MVKTTVSTVSLQTQEHAANELVATQWGETRDLRCCQENKKCYVYAVIPILQHAIERVERPGGSHEGVGRKKILLHLPN